MALLEILHYPDPRLREVARPVEQFTPEVERLVEDMAETMYDAPGVGLAAPQVGVSLRIFVVDIADESEPSQLHVFVNPEIVEAGGSISWTEGCLSFPGVTEDVKRAARVKVRARDAKGSPFELDAEGLLAVAIQHELDHLNGVLMVDKMNPLKRRMVGRKLAARAP